MKSSTAFIRSLPLLAGTYARKFNVQVRIQGTEAYTNGSMITLPRMEINSECDEQVVLSYLAHEAAHIKYSDMALFAGIKNPLVKNFFNIFEDCRIEYLISRKYVGIYENFESSLPRIFKTADLKDDLNLLPLVGAYCVSAGREMLCDYGVLTSYMNKARDLLIKRDPELCKAVEALVAILPEAQTCEEIKALAQKMAALLTEKAPRREHNNPLAESKPEGPAGSETAESAFQPLVKAMASRFAKENATLCSARHDYGQVIEGQAVPCDDPHSIEVFEAELNRAHNLRAVLSQKIRAYVESYKGHCRQSREIDCHKAQFIPFGEDRIFKQRELELDYSTSVQILVDASGSMLSTDGGKFPRSFVANTSACSLCLALEGIEGVKTAATIFPDVKAEYADLLSFNQRAHLRKKFFMQSPRGSTPMAQALLHALENVQKADCNRNLVFVITDGIPDSVELTKKALKTLKDAGIEVYGIGINVHFITELFERSTMITDTKQLPKVLHKVLADAFKINPSLIAA